jgi:hypothetical protein
MFLAELIELFKPAEGILRDGLSFFIAWSPLWVPLFLINIFSRTWVSYVRSKFLIEKSKSAVLLEVTLPPEISKSPKAMELVLDAIHKPFGETTWIDRYIAGKVRGVFSLEIVSLGGRVHFYIWTWKDFIRDIQNHLYAQYPEAEIIEVPDYTKAIKYKKEEYSLFGAEFVLSAPDPYPIKTYIDYGLDKDPKEEFKIDPMTPFLEGLGALTAGHQIWMQIHIRAHVKEDRAVWWSPFKKTDKWKDQVQTEIEDIIKKRRVQGDEGAPVIMTEFEKTKVDALEKSTTKPGFDVGIRAVYFAPKDIFDASYIGTMMGSLKQYSSEGLNGFKPLTTTSFVYPWQDFRGMRIDAKKRYIFDAYRRRSWFHPPYKRKHFVLNSEELATIYHFPGSTVSTPGIQRVDAKKVDAPSNIPT